MRTTTRLAEDIQAVLCFMIFGPPIGGVVLFLFDIFKGLPYGIHASINITHIPTMILLTFIGSYFAGLIPAFLSGYIIVTIRRFGAQKFLLTFLAFPVGAISQFSSYYVKPPWQLYLLAGFVSIVCTALFNRQRIKSQY